jgi:hypothetical protein
MTRGVVLDLDQAGVALPGHSQRVEFNAGPGRLPGEIFSKVYRMALT